MNQVISKLTHMTRSRRVLSQYQPLSRCSLCDHYITRITPGIKRKMLNKTKRKMLHRTKDTDLIINEIHKLNDQVQKLVATLERKAKFEGFRMACSMMATAATIASTAVSITNDHNAGLRDKLKDNPLLSFFKGLLERVPVGKE